jgi:hypothetical protein
MTFDGEKWIGQKYDSGPHGLGGECKFWLQQNVIADALNGVTIPRHDLNNSLGVYQWNLDDPLAVNVDIKYQKINLNDSVTFKSLADQHKVIAGDIVQVTGSSFNGLHTYMIGPIAENGIWVIHSNWAQSDTPSVQFLPYSLLDNNDRFTIYRLK